MIVIGGLTRSNDFAETVDAEWRKAMSTSDRPADMSDEEWNALIERISTQSGQIIAEQVEHEERFHERGDFYRGPDGLDASTVPAGIARAAVIANSASHLTLRDARIFAPSQPGSTSIPVLRIAIDQVSGWWILASDESGNATFQLWRTDDPATSRAGS